MEPEEQSENEFTEEQELSSELNSPIEAASDSADADVITTPESDTSEADAPETDIPEELASAESIVDAESDAPEEESDEALFEDAPLDIDAALAAVAELHEALAEQESKIENEFEQLDATAEEIEDEQLESAAREAAKAAFMLPRPPLMVVERGHAASVLAALALMGLGAWLSFTQATTDTALSVETVIVAAIFSAGIALFGYWLTSARWARGALFSGLVCLGSAATVLFLVQPDSPGAEGWPLLITVMGAAVLISGIISLPVARNQGFFGLLLIITGLAGYAVSAELLGTDITDSIRTVAPFVLIIGALVLLAPAISRRR